MVIAKAPKKDQLEVEDERSPEKTERIREATLKRLLNTRPMTHADIIEESQAKRGRERRA